MTSTERKRRHIHIGTRLEIAERVRRGLVTAHDAARSLGVGEDEVMRWVESGERPISLDDVVLPPEAQRLVRRARRLLALIEEAEREIRALTTRLSESRRVAPRAGAEARTQISW